MNYFNHSPIISPTAFIAKNTSIIGNVTIGNNSSVWFNSVIRGDVASISIGDNTNIQDGSVIHVTRNIGPTIIGNNVTIGHKALIHAATICDYGFMGMGAIMLDDSRIESFAMLAAGGLLTRGKIVKKGEIWAGNPAKFLRMMSVAEMDYITISADNYVQYAKQYLGFNK